MKLTIGTKINFGLSLMGLLILLAVGAGYYGTSRRILASDIEQAAGVISGLQQETENIGKVLEVIRGIAEQTNLLALNAAIEEINEMITRLQQGASEAVDTMSKSQNRHAPLWTRWRRQAIPLRPLPMPSPLSAT